MRPSASGLRQEPAAFGLKQADRVDRGAGEDIREQEPDLLPTERKRIELVQSHTTSGSVSGRHSDDVLCRYFSPARVMATIVYGEQRPQPVGRQ